MAADDTDPRSTALDRCILRLAELSQHEHEQDVLLGLRQRLERIIAQVTPDRAVDWTRRIDMALADSQEDIEVLGEIDPDSPDCARKARGLLQRRRAGRLQRIADDFREQWALGEFGEARRHDPPAGATAFETLERLSNRFHRVALQLRTRRKGRPAVVIADEYDVQYLMGALLALEFEDVRPEDSVPSQAGANARIDFVLRREGVGVEAKCTRDNLGDAEVGAELAVDVVRYQKHPDCRSLFCFVYDPEHRIKNPRGLEDDLTSDKYGMPVVVRVRPTR